MSVSEQPNGQAAPAIPADGRRTLATTCAAHFVHDGIADALYVILPIWAQAFGLSYVQVGTLRMAYSAAMAFLQLPAGMLAERVGERALLAGGSVLAGVAFALLATSQSYAALGGLILAFLVCTGLTCSRFGLLLIALRDDPRRLRALGYNPVAINVLIFTISAGLAGMAGALFAPIVGIVSPAMIGVVPSIEMVIWVAVGGRGTLIGPIIGALIVNGAKSSLSESFPLIWQYFLGALFVGSVLFFPQGVYGFLRQAVTRITAGRGRPEVMDDAESDPTVLQAGSRA